MKQRLKEDPSERIRLILNGKERKVEIFPGMMLVDLLRDQLRLTGTKTGCRRGECGACTVLIGGKPFLSCLFPASRAAGQKITTIEGLKTDGHLHPIQKAFIAKGAVQCGFCTPGMILSATALLQDNPHPSLSEIQRALSGNLCRCGGYPKIFKAIRSAGKGTRKSL